MRINPGAESALGSSQPKLTFLNCPVAPPWGWSDFLFAFLGLAAQAIIGRAVGAQQERIIVQRR